MDVGRSANFYPLVPTDGLFAGITGSPPVGDRALVSVFTSTGKVGSHPLNVTDQFNNVTGATGPDNYADFPFVFAELGEVSGR